MEKQRENGKLDRLRKKLMQGVLGCLFAMGIMLLMPGTEMKAQAEDKFTVGGITYQLLPGGGKVGVQGYNSTEAGTEVHIPAEIEDRAGNRYRVTGIQQSAFDSSALEKITLEEGLEWIADCAFGETQITEIEIPASVTTISSYVFIDCSELKKIRFRGTTPPEMFNAFREISGTITIEIPQGADEKNGNGNYKEAVLI